MDKKKKIALWSAVFLLGLNFLAWQEVFALNSPRLLRVDFLDVGQGDSAFIETPQGHQILIDGGPTAAVLEKLAERMPFWDKSIDLVILTHPESDHMSGIMEVLQRYDADHFLWTGIVRDNPGYKELADILQKKENQPQNSWFAALNPRKMKILSVFAGHKIVAGGAVIDILYPAENLAGKETKETSNNAGVVAKLIFGKNSFLFTGDISSAAENKIENIKADVLKVAHHGSKYSTSEEFLANVKPKIAVIEVGKNSYGHPTPEVLQRLEKFGIKVKRTDQLGDINMVSDGNNIYIK